MLTRLEQALPRQQREAVAAADAAAREAHKSEKARESLVGSILPLLSWVNAYSVLGHRVIMGAGEPGGLDAVRRRPAKKMR